MELDEIRVEVDRILDADLGELTRSGGLSILPAMRPEDWQLPGQDKEALWRYGLPAQRSDGLIGVVGGFQAGRRPEVDHAGTPLYVLGGYGTSRLVASAEIGTVLAIPELAEVHPDLRHLYPSGLKPSVVNSTVADLVDCAWRWHWLLPLLAEQETLAGATEVEAWRSGQKEEDLPDFYAPYRDICTHILRRFQARDSVIGPAADFWTNAIVDLS